MQKVRHITGVTIVEEPRDRTVPRDPELRTSAARGPLRKTREARSRVRDYKAR